MRASVVIAAVIASVAMVVAEGASAQSKHGPAPSDADLSRARALDQQGVRAFREGRYNDAIRYFDDAYKLGGPASELWNIARCHIKLDEPREASDAFERYLAEPNLSAKDRADAKQELDELQKRRSTVTVASSPSGASVAIDGKKRGRTPVSVDVGAGEHTVAVEREGYPPYVQRVDARYGRAVIIDAQLGGEHGRRKGGERSGIAGDHARRFVASAELAAMFARLGSVGRPAHPAGLFAVGYSVVDADELVATLGVRATVTYDHWSNTVGALPPVGCSVADEEYATAVSFFADGALGYRVTSRLRIGGDVGLGLAMTSASEVSGDLWNPTCQAATGVRPALHLGSELSYALTPALRGVLSPLVVELHSAFGGARSSPIDASGAWLRLGAGLGLAVDL